jgi:hypothetical protein
MSKDGRHSCRLLHLALAAALGFSGGCARHYRTSHSGYRAGLFLPQSFAPKWENNSTLGTNMLRAPKGQSIPPPSLGVDLVGYQASIAPSSLEHAAGMAQGDQG